MSEPSVFSPSSGNLKSTGLVPWWEKFYRRHYLLQGSLSLTHWSIQDPIRHLNWHPSHLPIWHPLRRLIWHPIDISVRHNFELYVNLRIYVQIFSLSLLENLYSQDTSTGRGWCSTLTDKSAYHISGKGSWGECNLVTSAGITQLYFHIWNDLSLQWPARATRTVSTLIKQSLASKWKRTWRSARRWTKQMSAKPTSSAT